MRYIESEGTVGELVSIDSIIDIDSLNLYAHYNKIVALNDSVHEALIAEIQTKTENMPKIKPHKIADAMSIVERMGKLPSYQKAAENYQDKIAEFLENIPQEKGWCKTYKIVTRFKDGQRIYYVSNIAFQDTIVVSTDSTKTTDRLKRILRYFDNYLLESAAKQKVLLDDVKSLHND